MPPVYYYCYLPVAHLIGAVFHHIDYNRTVTHYKGKKSYLIAVDSTLKIDPKVTYIIYQGWYREYSVTDYQEPRS